MAAPRSSSIDENYKTIQALLTRPAAKIDFARVKLTVDRMADPSVDIERELKQLDAMAAEIQARLPAKPSSRDKLEALKTYLYQPGPWNDNRPFSYDLSDPRGKRFRSRLLSNYLGTRKGNCVSMPHLFLILGRKIGLDLSLATAPEHNFVIYRDETGTSYNLETTSGAGFTREVWIRKQMPMTDLAIKNGLYLKPLTAREEVLSISQTLLEFYADKRMEGPRVGLAFMLLKYAPTFVPAMLHWASANERIRQRDFIRNYPRPIDIPPELIGRFFQLEEEMEYLWSKAESLGWRLPPPENSKPRS
ncbi:transglutaminase family protein [Chitinimonas sp. PSY-7]|uniref:transglutaminase family protein n=1 Tax=Chitinimonas sp. PSY-7 TaxID=3459088 RepID=UPI00403FF088